MPREQRTVFDDQNNARVEWIDRSWRLRDLPGGRWLSGQLGRLVWWMDHRHHARQSADFHSGLWCDVADLTQDDAATLGLRGWRWRIAEWVLG